MSREEQARGRIVPDLRETFRVDETVRMVGRVTSETDLHGHGAADVGCVRRRCMHRAGSVTRLALDVADRLLGIPQPKSGRGSVRHDVTGDATRLEISGEIDKGLGSA